MTTQLLERSVTQASPLLELNAAQTAIYNRSNLRRAIEGFDDAEINGIYLRDNLVVVVRVDGSEQTYPRELVVTAYQKFTFRLKDFFSYLGPNYRGPSIWHNNAYILFKGWTYHHALGHLSSSAKLQAAWSDRFIHINNQEKIEALLQSDQTDLGYLIAPDGFRHMQSLELGSAVTEDTEETEQAEVIQPPPYCSCGSFKRQLNNIQDFQKEIEGHRPWCIHMTWVQKYREFLSERSRVRTESRGGAVEKCVAWAYAPPEDHISQGRFILLHTNSGSMAPISHWRTYKPKELFTQEHAWDLFFNMLEAGYVPFPLTSLPQLSSILKKK
jgi:hypothetical protein